MGGESMGNERWHDGEEPVPDMTQTGRAKTDEPPDLVYA